MRRDLPTWLDQVLVAAVAVIGAAYYLFVLARVTGPGFPLDDSWIHAQFARNLATGHGFSYNPGVPTSGSTAPLWTFIIAVPALFRIDPVVSAAGVGTILTVVTALAAGRIARMLTASRFAAVVAGLAVAFSPRMTWASVSGMEVSLYCALTSLTVLAYLRSLRRNDRGVSWAILAGLTGTARPEAFLVFPILFAHRAWQSRHEGAAHAIRRLALPAAAFCAVFAAYLAFNFAVGGHPLPNTFYAKNGSRGLLHAIMEADLAALRASVLTQPIDALNTFLKWALDQSLFLSLAVLVGVLVSAGALAIPGADGRGAVVVAAIVLLSPVLKGALVPLPSVSTHNGRYVAHLLVLYFVLGSVGLSYLLHQARKRWVVLAFTVLALARLASQDGKYAATYAAQVKNINDLQVATAAWLDRHTSADSLVATNDIGAIAYFARRPIIDLEGLVTPAVIPFNRGGKVDVYLQDARPDLVVIFPEWYPELSARTDLLHEIGRFTVRPAVIAGGETLVIYRTPWTRPAHLIGVEVAGTEAVRQGHPDAAPRRGPS